MICKVSLCKYLGVWLLSEGSCILSGVGFGGYDEKGNAKWNRLSNIKPWLFETSLTLQGIIQSFNINTNDWVKRYIFKRLKFLNNRHLSSLGALFFLAIWHGFAPGYFLCFGLEFFDIEAERKLQALLSPISKFTQNNPSSPITYVASLLCWVARTSTLHYGLMAFIAKTWSVSMDLYRATFWIGHIAPIAVMLLDPILSPLLVEKKKKT